ncbi:MAG: tetratricopeptide repeat protein [Desulfobulbus sp.]|nr:tetratricopeptide repeat protein [Desulfobulbus sp.]
MDTIAIFQQAAAMHQAGQIDKAVEHYRQILAATPDFPEALHLLGVGLYQQGKAQEALRTIGEAILRAPDQPDFYSNFGEICKEINEPILAFFAYRQALLLDQFHTQAQEGIEQLRREYPDLHVFRPHHQLGQDIARHSFPTLALSQDDEQHPPDAELIHLALQGAKQAHKIDLAAIAGRYDRETASYIQLWPGEHYKLLAALVRIRTPQLIVEIGTASGASALALKKFLPKHGRIITYDIVPWQEYPGCGLQEDDFDHQLEQRILDLSNPIVALNQQSELAQADMVFVDAAKDGQMEYFFCDFFERTAFVSPSPLIVFDDIRMPEMLALWRAIKHPKLDFTSFGHWSGTGLVLWK